MKNGYSFYYSFNFPVCLKLFKSWEHEKIICFSLHFNWSFHLSLIKVCKKS